MAGWNVDGSLDSKSPWESVAPMTSDILIGQFQDREYLDVAQLIRSTMSQHAEAGSVIASTLRRISDFQGTYRQEGCLYFVARDMSRDGVCIGGAGIGPLHGLPLSEGVGEVRDIVVTDQYRSRGIGTSLLKRCLNEARKLGYKRLYLEATPDMKIAQKLFQRFGFRPVTQGALNLDSAPGQQEGDNSPCYYLIDHLDTKMPEP